MKTLDSKLFEKSQINKNELSSISGGVQCKEDVYTGSGPTGDGGYAHEFCDGDGNL
ncbi:bacteriocin [Marinifilum sp.]|uniref:bacteriocin n=1 Tax=Marinifilum sp. TaxID=2033137 RepID=UPI003BAD1638